MSHDSPQHGGCFAIPNLQMGFRLLPGIAAALALFACGPGQPLGPTLTPSVTATPIATLTPLPTATPTATVTPTPHPLSAIDLTTISLQPGDIATDFRLDEANRQSDDPGVVNFGGFTFETSVVQTCTASVSGLSVTLDVTPRYLNSIALYSDESLAVEAFGRASSAGDIVPIPTIGDESRAFGLTEIFALLTIEWRFREAVVSLTTTGCSIASDNLVRVAQLMQGRLSAAMDQIAP